MTPMPDAEYVLTTWLREHPTVEAHVDVTYAGLLPCVVVTRIGGLADYLGVVDHPRCDIEVWAATKEGAHDLAACVRQATHAINGEVVGGAQCGAVFEVLGLRSLTDTDTEVERYLFTVEVVMRAVPAP